jgi:hypothetical protein
MPKGPRPRLDGRTRRGNGCPFCRGFKASVTNSLATLHPDIATQWHPSKNGNLTPEGIVAGSEQKVWWKCPKGLDHEWQSTLDHRTRSGRGCPFCQGLKASVTNSLATRHPDIASQWHPTKNGNLTPEGIVAGSEKKVWWKCPKGPDHEWQSILANRTRHGVGCPLCNSGWTIGAIRNFVSSLRPHLHTFTPAELYLLFQQNGLLQSQGKGSAFVKALATGRFPEAEIEKFIASAPSLVDQFVQDPKQTLEALEVNDNAVLADEVDYEVNEVIDELDEVEDSILPAVQVAVQVKEVLASIDHHLISSADEEAVEFLISSALAKLWKHTFSDETAAVTQAAEFHGGEYAEVVRDKFLDEYNRAKQLSIPAGYDFRIDGQLTLPNLMQRLIAVRVRDSKRVGNWSGTGAGKTLSAVLTSRVVGANLTVVCCPNSVVDGWRDAIKGIFPDTLVCTKTFTPNWASTTADEMGFGTACSFNKPRYLILNYEAFQQPNSDSLLRSLTERECIDMVVVDEVHFAKQRFTEDISLRRERINTLIALAGKHNPDIHVLGMSATPVINNLQEGRSMVELVTGVTYDDLKTQPTVPNCMRVHQKLATLGIRWMPEYNLAYEQLEIEVDGSTLLDEVRALGSNGTPLALEQILTKVRLPVIREHIQPKTLIYTHYIQGIDQLLWDALEQDGWKTGFYTGEDKAGLAGFLEGDIDVLIGSSAISTGIDGLQRVCSRVIVNVLPWTAAEFDQLKGRIYRQGQGQDKVTVVIPLTYAEVNGERWSWCKSRMNRLHFKKSVADAAIDGVVPEGQLRTAAQAYQDVMGWLERLDGGTVQLISRPEINVPLPEDSPSDVERRRRYYGDFSMMNRRWNQSQSHVTHERLRANPEEWCHYHSLYREARKAWAVIPFKEMIHWCQQRSGYTIGDFGCGEAHLAEAVSDRHIVHSFDHVAVNAGITACDMAHVPLDDETLDVAIFSLSLMGSNSSDYLQEAYRTLKLDGHLHIIEATSHFSQLERFLADLASLGFDIVRAEDLWKFTHIHGIKIDRGRREKVEIHF